MLNRSSRFFNEFPAVSAVKEIISSLDVQNRWLVKHAMISNPYISEGENNKLTDEFASVNVGDKTDTSPFRDPSDQLYISTQEYIKNMSVLINYLKSVQEKKPANKNEVVVNGQQ